MTGRFRIEFRTLSRNRLADPPEKGTALVTILKDDPEAGPVTLTAVHQEGDLVGRPIDAASTRHRVFSPSKNREMEVEFHTGVTLLEVNPEQVMAGGSSEGPGTWVVDQVVVGWPDGNWEWLLLGTDSDVVGVPKPRPLKTRYTDLHAARMLYEADDFWLSKNPKVKKRAQNIYCALLRECPETSPVRSHWKRIKLRAEARLEEE